MTNPIKTARLVIRLLAPPDALEELDRPPPSSYYKGWTAIVLICTAGGLVAYWSNPLVGLIVSGSLAFAGLVYAISQSRKRHLAYEAMLAAERKCQHGGAETT